MPKIGIIGGSGFYKIGVMSGETTKLLETPFGTVRVYLGKIRGRDVAFIPRHGREHSVPPHMINYRANAYAMHMLGVEYVVATSAVGSLREEYRPGDLLVPDQIIDFTKSRTYTFFDGKFSIVLRDGRKRGGVYHADMTHPYCESLRRIILEAARSRGIHIHYGGTYICTEGPRFETPAEIEFFRMIGGDVVGMTNSPEVFLFKELDICYATICVITNYAAGMQQRITQEEVIEVFAKKADQLAQLIAEIVDRIG